MKKILAVIIIFLSTHCFAQTMNISGRIPQADSNKLYRIQVGSFRQVHNAARVFNRLRNAGLNPVYENFTDYTRVALSNISAGNIPHVLNILQNAGFNDVWIREEKPVSVFTIMTSGGGTVNEITNTGRNEPLEIVQTIPSFPGGESIENKYPVNAPIVFFFNEKIYLYSLEGNIELSADGSPIDGTIIISEGENGFAVLTLTPNTSLPAGKNIYVTVKDNLLDGGGNRMMENVSLSFITEQGSETSFNRNNFGFEAGSNGVFFTGDGAISTARGDLIPFEGNYYAAISTGEKIVSKEGEAIGSSTSQILLGPVQETFSSLVFHYNFISAEFNEYIGSEFDDNAMVTIFGPEGTYTEIITTVNRVGNNNTMFSNYPGMPDEGDSYAGQTGWQRYQIDNINVGFPAYINFTVTDVADDIYSSILAVDAIELK